MRTRIGGSDGSANGLVIQPDGQLVAAGTSSDNDFLILRYRANGSLDPSFGSGGMVTTPFSSDGPAAPQALVTQRDGKLVAAGESVSGSNFPKYLFTLVRYNPNGSFDRSFGSGGMVTTLFGSHDAKAHALAIQKDGKLVAAGDSSDGSPSVFALVRYLK